MSNPPRQWLYDRSNGESKVGNSRPPLPLCWPPPCVKLCPPLMEDNIVCKTIGRWGLVTHEDKTIRNWLMRIGFVANMIGAILTFYSCFAISENFDTLQRVSFSSALATPRFGNIEGIQDTTAHLGLRAVAIDNPNLFGKMVVPFDQICNFTQETEAVNYYVEDDACNDCADESDGLVVSTIMSVITYIPTLSTNILRMFSNYDVNCQKGFSTILSFVTLILSISTLIQYSTNCYASFYEGTIGISQEGLVLAPEDFEDAVFAINWEWSAGSAYIALFIGTCLKFIDICCHMLLITPSITRDLQEQLEYESKYGKNNKSNNNNDDENDNENDDENDEKEQEEKIEA